MGFYFVTTGWIFEIGLRENSINQINYTNINVPSRKHKTEDSKPNLFFFEFFTINYLQVNL